MAIDADYPQIIGAHSSTDPSRVHLFVTGADLAIAFTALAADTRNSPETKRVSRLKQMPLDLCTSQLRSLDFGSSSSLVQIGYRSIGGTDFIHRIRLSSGQQCSPAIHSVGHLVTTTQPAATGSLHIATPITGFWFLFVAGTDWLSIHWVGQISYTELDLALASTVHRRSTVSAILLQLSGQHCSPAIHSVGHLVTTVSSSDMSYQQLT
ncbi:hypothetical protein ZIOFF_071312 [Zingiber officinale]|uniref:Uncharacterized protein n=1 Tax=Zingiber officinale TaxID=94328 RepID=A0A8J5C3K8_ZINOF|nr:hypothetical protein ZIOFF_071312 [Zingiber officinale]